MHAAILARRMLGIPHGRKSMPENLRARAARATGALPLTLAFALLCALAYAGVAEADSRIRTGNCDAYKTVVQDNIARTLHQHSFFGGINNSQAETGSDIKARNRTSCQSIGSDFGTSSGWFPRAQSMAANKATFYYRDPGNYRVNPIPTDLRMLSSTTVFNSQGNPRKATVHFPNCVKVDAQGKPVLDSPDHKSHLEDKVSRPCDSSHPYRIPRTSYLIDWPQAFTTSTMVSMGTNQWMAAGGGMFHADYLSALQDEFNYATREGPALIDLCLNNVPESTEVAHPRCGPDPNP